MKTELVQLQPKLEEAKVENANMMQVKCPEFFKNWWQKIIESGPRNIFTGVHSNLKYKSQSSLGERGYEKSRNKWTNKKRVRIFTSKTLEVNSFACNFACKRQQHCYSLLRPLYLSCSQVPCNGFSDIENLEGPEIFFEDELVCILNMEGR